MGNNNSNVQGSIQQSGRRSNSNSQSGIQQAGGNNSNGQSGRFTKDFKSYFSYNNFNFNFKVFNSTDVDQTPTVKPVNFILNSLEQFLINFIF